MNDEYRQWNEKRLGEDLVQIEKECERVNALFDTCNTPEKMKYVLDEVDFVENLFRNFKNEAKDYGLVGVFQGKELFQRVESYIAIMNEEAAELEGILETLEGEKRKRKRKRKRVRDDSGDFDDLAANLFEGL